LLSLVVVEAGDLDFTVFLAVAPASVFFFVVAMYGNNLFYVFKFLHLLNYNFFLN
jgi:hypothetical protein